MLGGHVRRGWRAPAQHLLVLLEQPLVKLLLTAVQSVRDVQNRPEYMRLQSVDIDAVIIGAWSGTGGRGGIMAQYLLALLERKMDDKSAEPPKYVSFCKCADRALARAPTPRAAAQCLRD